MKELDAYLDKALNERAAVSLDVNTQGKVKFIINDEKTGEKLQGRGIDVSKAYTITLENGLISKDDLITELARQMDAVNTIRIKTDSEDSKLISVNDKIEFVVIDFAEESKVLQLKYVKPDER